MPIIPLETAKSVNDQVRTRFAKGFKSSNKVYHHPITDKDPITLDELSHFNLDEMTPQATAEPEVKKLHEQLAEKYRRRNKNAFAATVARAKIEATAYSAALERIAEAKLAGNCAEMAIYAAQLVNALPAGRGLAHLGSLQSPGDHAFCICIAQKKAPWKVLPTIDQFKNSDGFSEWVVIDPWLNVWCTANNYPDMVEQQLTQWGFNGKRIMWAGKFYLPTGAYKQTLMKTAVKFTQYK